MYDARWKYSFQEGKQKVHVFMKQPHRYFSDYSTTESGISPSFRRSVDIWGSTVHVVSQNWSILVIYGASHHEMSPVSH